MFHDPKKEINLRFVWDFAEREQSAKTIDFQKLNDYALLRQLNEDDRQSDAKNETFRISHNIYANLINIKASL